MRGPGEEGPGRGGGVQARGAPWLLREGRASTRAKRRSVSRAFEGRESPGTKSVHCIRP